MVATTPAPGTIIDGFQLTERLASGGMGSVWRAAKSGIDLPILMKIPFIEPGDDVSAIVGFEVEEMITRRLSGPHVPRFFASGDLGAVPYIAMEFVQGEPLNEVAARAPLSWQTAVIYACEIAAAVDALHRQKVSHLDLKPENIILVPDRGAVLIDFGLARHDELPDLLGEESSLPIGTPAYIAPEQIRGDRTHHASDIYAIGCMLYELTTGEKPFGEPTTRSGMERRIVRAPKPPRAIRKSIPRWLQEIILKCLEVDPARRYPTAGQLLFDLRQPEHVVVTERGNGEREEPVWRRLLRAFRPGGGKPAGVAAPITAKLDKAAVVMAAIDLGGEHLALAEEVRVHVGRVLAFNPDARLACVTVLKTKLAGEDEAVDAEGRPTYLGRLVTLKEWARPLRLAEEAVSYHVLEAVDVAGAIIHYAAHNRVDHVVMGARGSSSLRRHLGSVSAQVVAEAQCSVTVVRLKQTAV